MTRCEPGRYVHSCADPLACALTDLAEGDDPTRAELDRTHELLDRIEEACEAAKTSKAARSVLTLIHAERGDPRG